jgi:hypothetical protein
MTCVYWANLSHCTPIPTSITINGEAPAQYSCDQRTAYGATSAFAALLFISQTVLVTIVVVFRGDLIAEVVGTSGTGSGTTGGGRYVGIPRDEEDVQKTRGLYFPVHAQTADL